LQLAAHTRQTSIWEQIEEGNLVEFGIKSSAVVKLKDFVQLVKEVAEHQHTTDAYTFALEVAARSGYLAEVKNDLSVEGRARLENIEELFNGIDEFVRDDFMVNEDIASEDEHPLVTIHSYLSNVALITDWEEKSDAQEPKVSLMTVHAAKGLEFKYVYIVGMEENLFPSSMSAGSLRELEEERRLFYVALTRAKSAVTLAYAQTRYRWGKSEPHLPSRFIREIDPQWINRPLQREAKPMLRTQPVHHTQLLPRSQSLPHTDSRFAAMEPASYKTGQRVEHEQFGAGTILSLEGKTLSDQKATVHFDLCGVKTLLLKFARMRVI